MQKSKIKGPQRWALGAGDPFSEVSDTRVKHHWCNTSSTHTSLSALRVLSEVGERLGLWKPEVGLAFDSRETTLEGEGCPAGPVHSRPLLPLPRGFSKMTTS